MVGHVPSFCLQLQYVTKFQNPRDTISRKRDFWIDSGPIGQFQNNKKNYDRSFYYFTGCFHAFGFNEIYILRELDLSEDTNLFVISYFYAMCLSNNYLQNRTPKKNNNGHQFHSHLLIENPGKAKKKRLSYSFKTASFLWF